MAGVAQSVSLGGGLMTLSLPAGWRLDQASLDQGRLLGPGQPPVSYSLQCFEAPDGFDDERVAECALGPHWRDHSLQAADLTTQLCMLFEQARDGMPPRAVVINVERLGTTHLRVARFWLPAEPGQENKATQALLALSEIVRQARYADQPTPLDRIAASDELKQLWIGLQLGFRLPVGWRPEPGEEGDDRLCFEPPEDQRPPRPSLWVDVNPMTISGQWPGWRRRFVQKTVAGLKHASGRSLQVRELQEREDGFLLATEAAGEEEGEPLRFFNLHHLVLGESRAALVHFNLVFVEEELALPASQRLIGLLYRELSQAVIVAEPAMPAGDLPPR